MVNTFGFEMQIWLVGLNQVSNDSSKTYISEAQLLQQVHS